MDGHSNQNLSIARMSRNKKTVLTLCFLSLIALIAAKISGLFDTFNREHLITTAFGMDLNPHVEKEKTTYSDGCLQFHEISKSHPLFLRHFSVPHEKTFHISFLHEEFNDPHARDSFYLHRVGKSFDGYVPIVAYIPRLKRLVFGYCDGMGG